MRDNSILYQGLKGRPNIIPGAPEIRTFLSDIVGERKTVICHFVGFLIKSKI